MTYDTTPDGWSTDPAAEIERLAGQLCTSQGRAGVVLVLQTASRLVENAAYETARLENASHVAHLILSASDLERMAQRISQR